MAKKILVIDDSALMRRVISDIINESNEYEVAAIAKDGLEGLDMIVSNPYEYSAVILDINMPKLNGLELLQIQQLTFEQSEEIFYHSIVQTVSLAAHALSDTLLAEHPLVLLVLILPTLIRVENQVCSGRDLCKRLVKHGGYHAEYRTIRYGITDQIATVQIENRGQIELFSKQAELRHIRDPFLIRLFGMEIPI